MSKRYRTVNDGTLRRALNKALKTLDTAEECSATMADAGFVIPGGQDPDEYKQGYQVFVKVYRYDEELLEDYPESGGLEQEAALIADAEGRPDHCDDAGTCKCSMGRRNDGK